MIKMIFCILICAFALSGCGSLTRGEFKEANTVTTDPKKDKVQTLNESGKTNVPAKENESLYEAIKNGSDEQIYKVAAKDLATNANDYRALTALGMYHYRRGRPLLAQYFYGKAVAIKPNSSEIYNSLGLTYLLLNQNKEAIQNFKKALELDSNNLNAAANLGSIYLKGFDYSKAYTVMSMAFRGVKDVRLLNNYALASAWAGKYDQADSLYQEALKLSPSNREILLNYATFQIAHQKKMKEGLDTINKLKFFGLDESMKQKINVLEKRAKAGVK